MRCNMGIVIDIFTKEILDVNEVISEGMSLYEQVLELKSELTEDELSEYFDNME